jgi:hypothetical protein
MENVVSQDESKLRFCIQCNKPKVYCKRMCQACYVKMYRQTESGKEVLKKYSSTKGKEAQKRYLEKKRIENPQKQKIVHNKICECGEKSIAKGFCRSCYHKDKYIKRTGRTGEKVNFQKKYELILIQLKKGFSIRESCELANSDTSTFYKNISPIQKAEVDRIVLLTRRSLNNNFEW